MHLAPHLLQPGRAAIAFGLTMAVLAGGCGGGSAAVPSTTRDAPSQPVSAPPTTAALSAPPAVDPDVARWARRWRHKIASPMRWAAARVVANAGPATGGDAFASYRLTRALDALSNCRTPFSVSLARTPAPLLRARRLSLAACRAFFTATEHVVAGINASDMAATRSGVAGVRAGLVLLKRAERVLEREARPA